MSDISGKKFSQKLIITALYFVAVALLAFVFLKPVIIAQKEGRERYLIRNAGIAIDTALNEYSRKNEGGYPAGNEIIGNYNEDALIKNKIIKSYPKNHHKNNHSVMKNIFYGIPETGDFSYKRNPEKTYEYELVVYGPGKEKIYIKRYGD